MIVYVAGPITGQLDYRKKFKEAEKMLQEKGHIVINPSNLPNGLAFYMSICKAMIDQADAVYFMDGWKYSEGSVIEESYAKKKKKKLFYEKDVTRPEFLNKVFNHPYRNLLIYDEMHEWPNRVY